MRIFATYNIKGGVGKTATAVNLAYLSAREGARTLIWDLDPQGAASFYFRIKPRIKGGSKKLVMGKKDLDELVKGTDYDNLDLLPADFSYRNMDLLLDDAKRPTRSLHRLLKPLAEDYDHLILDCPPSISLVSENVFYAAEVLLIPIIPTTLSQRTLAQLSDFVKSQKIKKVELLPFFSMVDRRKKLHLELLEALPKQYPQMLQTAIPYASNVEQMGIKRAPLASYARKSAATLAFEALWGEIKQKVG